MPQATVTTRIETTTAILQEKYPPEPSSPSFNKRRRLEQQQDNPKQQKQQPHEQEQEQQNDDDDETNRNTTKKQEQQQEQQPTTSTSAIELENIPSFDMMHHLSNDDSSSTVVLPKGFWNAFDTYQVVHLKRVRNVVATNKKDDDDDDDDDRGTFTAAATTTAEPSSASKEREDDDNDNDDALLDWKDIGRVYRGLHGSDRESFCIENDDDDDGKKNPPTKEDRGCYATDMFQPRCLPDRRAYCSFLIQHDTDLYRTTVDRLPVRELVFVPSPPTTTTAAAVAAEEEEEKEERSGSRCSSSIGWKYEPCLWIFFGRNSPSDHNNAENKKNMEGRPEHTDSVQHDGTWHYQLSGRKLWYLRPTCRLLDHLAGKKGIDNNNDEQLRRFCVDCREGDVLIVNTRVWFHQTILPPQENNVPSVSYARDFRFCDTNDTATKKKEEEEASSSNNNTAAAMTAATTTAAGGGTTTTMTNLDGLYATNDIDAGTVLFTEDDMPDCELHRSSTNHNCEVVEIERDGGVLQAVVASRPIAFGEFFCIAESDDEDGDDDEEEGDDDDIILEEDEAYDDEEE